SDAESVGARCGRRLEREAEPSHLTRTDPCGRRDGEAIEARPRCVRTAELPVAAEHARLILSRLVPPGTEICGLAHLPEHPPLRAGVVVRHHRRGLISWTQRHVSTLSVPGSVKARYPGGHSRRRRDPRSDLRGARTGGYGDGCERQDQESDQRKASHAVVNCRAALA